MQILLQDFNTKDEKTHNHIDHILTDRLGAFECT
jgi:hypothetical protein